MYHFFSKRMHFNLFKVTNTIRFFTAMLLALKYTLFYKASFQLFNLVNFIDPMLYSFYFR